MPIFPPDGYDPHYWPLDGTDPKWTRWFAWYPVKIDAYYSTKINAGPYYWLRWVECRLSPDGPPPDDVARMQFRLPQ